MVTLTRRTIHSPMNVVASPLAQGWLSLGKLECTSCVPPSPRDLRSKDHNSNFCANGFGLLFCCGSFLFIFCNSWDSYCWKYFESSKKAFVVLLCLLFLWRRELHGQRKGVIESSSFYIILNSQLREELKKENPQRKCCTISITTNLAAAKQE